MDGTRFIRALSLHWRRRKRRNAEVNGLVADYTYASRTGGGRLQSALSATLVLGLFVP